MDLEEKKLKLSFNVLAIIGILLFCFALSPVTLQNDTFYTIKIGELITKNGLDGQDHFSWHANLAYTYPHWAYDASIYFIYYLGELTGIEQGGMLFVYLSTVILACLLGIILYITNVKISKNHVLSLLFTLFMMYLLKDFIAARAQLVTFILFALTILSIETFLRSKKKRYLLCLVLISIAIANLHVAVWPFFFILFLPYIAEYIIAIMIEANIISKVILAYKKQKVDALEKKWKKETEEEKRKQLEAKMDQAKQELLKQQEKEEKIIGKAKQRRQHPYKLKISKNNAVKWLIGVMLLCILTGLLTPLGDTPYTYLLKTMQGNTMDSISEHQPLVLYNDKNMLIMLAIFLVILIFTKIKITLKDFFMLTGLIFLAFMSRRQTSMLIMVGGFIFTNWMAHLFHIYDKGGSKAFMKWMNTFLGKTLTLLVIILCCLVLWKPKMKAEFIDIAKYPVEASTWILENLDIENIRLYNEYNYGSYLLYRGIPVFIDSRADLYAPEFNKTEEQEGRNIFSDYINISTISTYYETKFEAYEITHVIVVNNAKLNMFLSRNEQYEQLYKDDYFTIYERH